jgi:hypothetical protein
MKLAIIGSRTFSDYELLCDHLEEHLNTTTMVVSGAARGADSMGEKWAKENGIKTLIFPAEWDKYGKRAGYIRNEDIIKNCDFCIAFWDGVSKGTMHSVSLCKKYNKQYKIINI